MKQKKQQKKNKELVFSVTKKDLEITYFSGGKKAGGQNINKHNNCVRIKHPESNVIVTGKDHRETRQNLKDALNRLAKHKDFILWCKLKASKNEVDILDIERKVNESMKEENLLIEYL